jgi:hypothetical protein
MTGRNCGASLVGPRLTRAAVKKWLAASQATVSFVHRRALCLRLARLKK